jgi:tetratricopeptide (TPR) repeat protein
MELRTPPRPAAGQPDPTLRVLLVVNLVAVLGLAAFVVFRSSSGAQRADGAERSREVASKLKAAGALDEAATLYEEYLAAARVPAETRARIAYSLGTTYLEVGDYQKALRWFYEAETVGAGDLAEELGARIVHCLERLGRHHAAQAALDSRVRLSADSAERATDDPVVARIGDEEILRSDLDRALSELPPEVARSLVGPEARGDLLKRYVADELVWRKAAKLEYDKDPEVRRRHEALLKQLAVSRFVEQEILGKIEVDPGDLQNYFEANRERYRVPASESEPEREPTFDEVRAVVERDYRLLKVQAAYESMVETELATAEVELFPERLIDGE